MTICLFINPVRSSLRLSKKLFVRAHPRPQTCCDYFFRELFLYKLNANAELLQISLEK